GDIRRQPFRELADQRRREAAVEQLLREARLRRLALELLYERAGAQALLDQALYRAQLAQHRFLVAPAEGGVGEAGGADRVDAQRIAIGRRGGGHVACLRGCAGG